MTDHTYARNNFTKFEYVVYARKRNSCHSAKTCMEKFVKSHHVNLFLAVLGHLEPPLSKKGEKPRGCIEVTKNCCVA